MLNLYLVTFHRAFDIVRDIKQGNASITLSKQFRLNFSCEALEDIASIPGVTRVLTRLFSRLILSLCIIS